MYSHFYHPESTRQTPPTPYSIPYGDITPFMILRPASAMEHPWLECSTADGRLPDRLMRASVPSQMNSPTGGRGDGHATSTAGFVAKIDGRLADRSVGPILWSCQLERQKSRRQPPSFYPSKHEKTPFSLAQKSASGTRVGLTIDQASFWCTVRPSGVWPWNHSG